MQELLNRLKHPSTIISLVGLIGMLLIQLGVKVDMEWLNNTVQIICSILILLGVVNDPTTEGIYLCKKCKDDKVEDKKN